MALTADGAKRFAAGGAELRAIWAGGTGEPSAPKWSERKDRGGEVSDQATWDCDWQLANDPVRQRNEAGAFDGLPLIYGYLEIPPKLSKTSVVDAARIGTTPVALSKILAISAQRLELFQTPAMGYCGWLLTNTQFIQEHDHLLAKWVRQVREVGLPIIAESGSQYRAWGSKPSSSGCAG